MEATCCLGNLLGSEVSGDEGRMHTHSNHLEAIVSQTVVLLGDTDQPRCTWYHTQEGPRFCASACDRPRDS